MINRFYTGTLKSARRLNLAACIMGALTLLTFPAQSAHQFTDHFRTPEVRRAIERHTPIAQGESEAAERIPLQAVVPTLSFLADADRAIIPISNYERSPQVQLPRMLSRLKLGSSSSDASDPLL
jgi:hypothetical protein